MDRRRFLAVAGLGVAAIAVGCSTVGGPTELCVDEERPGDERSEKHRCFGDDEKRVAVVSLDQVETQTAPTDPFRFRLHVQHGTGQEEFESVVERFRFDLRAPPTSVNPPAETTCRRPRAGCGST